MIHPHSTYRDNVLQFSGGKDSLATLYLLKPYWDQITVCWMNTGAAWPETIALMEQIKTIVPHFHEVRSDQPASIARDGWPVDVVSIRHAPVGHDFETGQKIKMRPYLLCCGENIFVPLMNHITENGFKLIIRGQRSGERMTNPIRSGHQEAGLTFWFPIEDWSEKQVFDFLIESGVPIPAHYEMTTTSLDCINCTAFWHEVGTHRWLKHRHPEQFEQVSATLKQLRDAIVSDLRYLDEEIEV